MVLLQCRLHVPGFGQLLCRIPAKELALVSKSVASLAALTLRSL